LWDAVDVTGDGAIGGARQHHLHVRAGGNRNRFSGGQVKEIERAVQIVEAGVAGGILEIKNPAVAGDVVEAEQRGDGVHRIGEQAGGRA
jgi:hypothetical protein